MKRLLMAAFFTALLLVTPAAWAGGMGSGMGGGMGSGMMGGDQWGGRQSLNSDRYQGQDRQRQYYDEENRRLRREIGAQQEALDRELDRTNPDMTKVRELNHDLSQLQDQLDHTERHLDQYQQGGTGRYGDDRYPGN